MNIKKVASGSLLVVGASMFLHASWIPIKAWLSEQLISVSWHQSQANDTAIKPWPWADTFPVAELSFERITKKIVVLNGGDPTTLAFSAGAVAPFNHVSDSRPFVVAGHRDSHFSFLSEVHMADVISLTDKQGRHQLYQVENIEIVNASDTQLSISAEDPNLVLITCYPFNSTSNDSDERYVITAKLLT